MDFLFGDVIWAAFPFTDGLGEKDRPVVVLSARSVNQTRPDLITAAISSKKALIRPRRFEMEILNLKEAGLTEPSLIKPVFTSLSKERVRKKSGRLSAPDREALQQWLFELMRDEG